MTSDLLFLGSEPDWEKPRFLAAKRICLRYGEVYKTLFNRPAAYKVKNVHPPICTATFNKLHNVGHVHKHAIDIATPLFTDTFRGEADQKHIGKFYEKTQKRLNHSTERQMLFHMSSCELVEEQSNKVDGYTF